jgi:hypothetical protein
VQSKSIEVGFGEKPKYTPYKKILYLQSKNEFKNKLVWN